MLTETLIESKKVISYQTDLLFGLEFRKTAASMRAFYSELGYSSVREILLLEELKFSSFFGEIKFSLRNSSTFSKTVAQEITP